MLRPDLEWKTDLVFLPGGQVTSCKLFETPQMKIFANIQEVFIGKEITYRVSSSITNGNTNNCIIGTSDKVINTLDEAKIRAVLQVDYTLNTTCVALQNALRHIRNTIFVDNSEIIVLKGEESNDNSSR